MASAAVLCAWLAACGTLVAPASAPPASPAAQPQAAAQRPAAAVPRPARPAPPAQPEQPTPRVQRLASGPPNHPYEIKGETYVPDDTDVPLREVGLASWYGRPFHGRRTANGEVYDMNRLTAAHKTMPLPSYARVRNLANGREIIVKVNDRGPFYPGRVIDLSRAAARQLRITGVAKVEVERITHDEIRSGAWRDRKPAAQRVASAL
ncbi:MAG: septal ring lytic transglycosylase RlpA family protein [Burkholderiaceae bacterium]